ncbi:MAG: SRPBCC family protein [Mycobacterium sp.]
MRYRDQPTVEVTQPVRCDVAAAWNLLTDIELPVRCSPELRAVQWLGDADAVRVGARFRGTNHNDALGTWEADCEIVEVEDQGDVRRWVWNVLVPDGVGATWAFEVEPAREGVLIRQWGRMGPDPSGLSTVIAARPELEGRIVSRRLSDWEQGMRANLDYVRAALEEPERD